MLEQMIVTDVSRMLSGACIAGYSTDLSRPIRPVRPAGGGLDWHELCIANGSLLAPFNVVEIELGDRRPIPPHCEDVVVQEPLTMTYLGRVPTEKVEVALTRLAFDSVQQAFDSLVVRNRYLMPGQAERSLATISVKHVDFLDIEAKPDDSTLRLRVHFRDGANDHYHLPVTDIGFRSMCHFQLVEQGYSPKLIGARIRERLNNARALYFRIGASRPFAPQPDREEVCYLLVTGVYSVPDYRSIPWAKLFPDSVPADGNPLPDDVVGTILGG